MNDSTGSPLLFAFSNLAVNGNCFLTTAAIVDTTTDSNSATYSLILLDSTGNILWKKHKIFNKEFVIYDVIPKTLINSGNNFYMLRTNVDYVADSIFPVIIKFNVKSNIINEYYLSNINFSFMGGSAHLINLSKDIKFAAVSARTDFNTASRIYIYKLDTNCNLINTYNYYSSGYSEIIPKLVKRNNSLILFSTLYKQISSSGFVSRIIARQIDTLGNFLGYFYAGSFADSLYGVEDVIATKDGGFLIATQRYTYSLSQNFQFTNGAFLKLSGTGVKQWMYFPGHYQFGADTSSVIANSYNAIELPSGDLMISGSYHQFKENGDTITPAELRPPVYFWFLSKLSSNGELKWNRLYNYVKPNNKRMYDLYNYDLDTCPDKGFILSGYLTDYVSGLSSGWLVKVDSMGCLIPGCHLSPPEEPTDSTVQVLLYPNPADQFINFVPKFFSGEVHYQLIDMQGRIIADGITANDVTNMMDVRELTPALYILQVYDEHTRISKKVVVQR
ncbi:hypothetical protein LBMAG25_09610 [Bacteroidota bacterium]|nr:hypothetical protein LBMAG25_09610 [Bacteroidota bacterium]